MGERKHSLLSPSGAHRWLYCTPSAKLEEQFPETTSSAAAEGTLAHELAELKLRNYFFAESFSKRKLSAAITKLKKEELYQEEMQRYTDDYLDYIRGVATGFPAKPYAAVEQRVDFGAYVPDGFGTADCVLISGNVLQVIDLKYGKGVPVSAEGNPQMALYALGAYELYKLLYPINRIRLSIVQPRISDAPSEWECSLKELLDWGAWAKGRAELAYKGEGEYSPGIATCRFCKAKAQCRARSDHNVKQAFSIDELPPLIDAAEAGKRLLALEDVVKYQKDLQEWALAECLKGNEVPGWKAVEGRSSREWTDMEEAFGALVTGGIPRALLFEERPLTLAQAEKAVGKKEFQELAGNYIIKVPGKPALVKEADKRPAITNKQSAQEVFKEEVEV